MANIHCPYCDRVFGVPELKGANTFKTEIVTNDELPYRIKWGELKSAGDSPSSALIRMLSIGGYIPANIKGRKEVAKYIFWNYQSFTPWANIIHILDTDSFKGGRNG